MNMKMNNELVSLVELVIKEDATQSQKERYRIGILSTYQIRSLLFNRFKKILSDFEVYDVDAIIDKSDKYKTKKFIPCSFQIYNKYKISNCDDISDGSFKVFKLLKEKLKDYNVKISFFREGYFCDGNECGDICFYDTAIIETVYIRYMDEKTFKHVCFKVYLSDNSSEFEDLKENITVEKPLTENSESIKSNYAKWIENNSEYLANLAYRVKQKELSVEEVTDLITIKMMDFTAIERELTNTNNVNF